MFEKIKFKKVRESFEKITSPRANKSEKAEKFKKNKEQANKTIDSMENGSSSAADIDGIMKSFGHPPTSYHLTKAYHIKVRAVENSAFAGKEIAAGGLNRDFNIAKRELEARATAADNQRINYEITGDEALREFGWPTSIEALDAIHKGMQENLNTRHKDSIPYFNEAYRAAKKALDDAESAETEFDDTKSSPPQNSSSIDNALQILGLDTSDFRKKEYAKQVSNIKITLRVWSLALHPDKNAGVEKFDFPENNPLARFNGMTPTDAIKQVNKAREGLAKFIQG